MRYLLAALLWLIPVTAFAGFVQQVGPVAPSGVTGTLTFSVAATPGNVGFIFVSNKNGTGSVSSIVGGSNNWIKIADSGSLASTSRTFIYCGVINAAATSVTVTTTSASVMQAAEFSGFTCTTRNTAQTANSTGATSITPTGFAATSGDLLLANASHLTTEAVTDGSTGYTNLINYAKSPTMNADYQIAGSTATYTPTWSWATSSGAGAASVAVEAGTNICFGSDACVQFSAVARVSTGNPAPALTNNTAVGDTFIAYLSLNNATATASISSGGVTSWATIGDSTNTGGTFGRAMIFCGIVTSAATTPTFSVSTGSSSAQLMELRGTTCTKDANANVASSAGATSTGLSAYTTTHASDVILAMAGHGTAEAVTDNNSTMHALTPFSANPPTMSADYVQVTKTGSITPSWQWTTSSRYGAAVVAIELAGSVQGYASFHTYAQATPASAPTPSTPNVGVYDFVGQHTNEVSATLPTGVNKGWAVNIPWAALEPSDGTFVWTPITNLEHPGQFLQVNIVTGSVGSPTSASVCPGLVPSCTTPWLANDGVTGVTSHWSQTFVFPSCATLFDPNPGDTTFQTKYKAFIAAYAAEFASDTHIALTSVHFVSGNGHDISLDWSSTCNGGEFYNSAWNTLSSAGGNEATWKTYLEGAQETMWNYQVSTLGAMNQAQWIFSTGVPSVASNTYDKSISTDLFNYFNTTTPTGGNYYIAQEALNNTSFSWSQVQPFVGGNTGAGAQAVNSYSNNCVTYCQACVNFGANLGYTWAQMYFSTINACASTTTKCDAALNGTPETCNPD